MADWSALAAIFSKVSSNDLNNVCHLVAESFSQDKPIKSDQLNSLWSIEEWWDVRAALVELMKKVVHQNWTKERIDKELSAVNDTHRALISEVISVHRVSLKRKLLQNTASISHAVLSDFDWKLQLALSSDKMSSLHHPFVTLDLDIRQSNGDRKNVTLEMDKEELTKFISSLESCSKSVQQLTVPS